MNFGNYLSCFSCISSTSLPYQDLRELEMDKEKLEISSPRGVLDNCVVSIESESGSSKASTSDFEAQPSIQDTSLRRRRFFGLFKSSAWLLMSFQIFSKSSRNVMGSVDSSAMIPPDQSTNLCYLKKSSWRNFTFAELQAATKNFCSENLLGKGGYAEVYKGVLRDGQLVAIKRLSRGTTEDRTWDFLSELGIIVHVDHHNAAKLIGYGIEGGMYIVLQFSPHGNLASLLHGSKDKLDWAVRYMVALGTAEGLVYLHESCPRRIIHRDIKASNILLTEEFEPQICDFGLAKWLPKQWTHHTVSRFEGTFGYLAPEYVMHGMVDEKTDVFAFGVLLLELITRRRAVDVAQQSLVMWAKPFLNKNNIREIIDPSLGDAYDAQQMNRMAMAASLCVQNSAIQRPRMSQVLLLLRGDEVKLEWTKHWQKPYLQRSFSEDLLFDPEEYNSVRYMNDLSRHRKIAFEV
ncbi:hypothetical protein Sjap_007674 [Stephania japonica]|uniref:non-specific serine/threonine protein kinase n=1 Tax=Stephania japonica TaxID=461633 RepID=A0AAP0PDX5_9MAGN